MCFNIKYLFQGLNVIDVVIQCGVKYIIFNGLENVKKIIGKECNYFDLKFVIEEYICEVGKYRWCDERCLFFDCYIVFEKFLIGYNYIFDIVLIIVI